jgi:hypothetical protein
MCRFLPDAQSSRSVQRNKAVTFAITIPTTDPRLRWEVASFVLLPAAIIGGDLITYAKLAER